MKAYSTHWFPLCLLGRYITRIDIGHIIVREILAVSVPILIVVSLCMPSCQSPNGMLSEGLVVVQQCFEGFTFPLIYSFIVEIWISLLVRIVNEELLEVVVVLVVVYIRCTQLSSQTVKNLVINTEETCEVGIMGDIPSDRCRAMQ